MLQLRTDTATHLRKLFAECEKSATMLTVYRDGSFDAYFDDKAADTRKVIHYSARYPHCDVKYLHGYSAEKNTWTRDGRSERIDLIGGVVIMKNAFRRLSDSLLGYYPRILSMYRHENGEWYAFR